MTDESEGAKALSWVEMFGRTTTGQRAGIAAILLATSGTSVTSAMHVLEVVQEAPQLAEEIHEIHEDLNYLVCLREKRAAELLGDVDGRDCRDLRAGAQP